VDKQKTAQVCGWKQKRSKGRKLMGLPAEKMVGGFYFVHSSGAFTWNTVPCGLCRGSPRALAGT